MKVLGFGLAAVLMAVSCGGGSGNGSGGGVGGVTLEVTSPVGPAAVDSGLVVPITVVVNNDSGNAGVIWTVSVRQKGDPAGTLSDIKPTSVTYNPAPPDQVKAPVQVSVIATSVTDPTRSVTIPISVYPAVGVVPLPNGLATAFPNIDYSCIQYPITQAGVTQIPCQVSVTGGLGPYTWTLDGGTFLPDGLFLGRGLTANDIAIVGKPNLSGIYPFTLRVSDAIGGASTVALNINVAPGQLKVSTPTILSTFVGKPYAPVALQVSGGVPPYVWSLAPGSAPLPPGMSLSPTGVIAGTPTTSDQAFFAVRVVDSQPLVPAEATFPAPALDPKQKIINLGVTTAETPCELGASSVQPDTPYAFSFAGFDTQGPVTLSGSFTADSHGDITSGVEDVIRSSGAQSAQPLTVGSSVVFDNTGRGCLVLNTGAGSTQFRAAPTTKNLATAFLEDGRLVEFDDTDGSGTRGSGVFRKQDSTAFPNALAGAYVLRLSGWNRNGGHFAMAGRAVADSGLFTSIIADVNDAGAVAGPVSGSGTFGPADENGRGTATIAIGSEVLDLIYYVVDATHVVFSSQNRASAGHPQITGEAISGNGPFSQSSLRDSQIYRLGGTAGGSSDLNIGVFHFDGAGSLSGVAFTRAGGSSGSTSLAGQYSVDSGSGRFSFSGTAIPAVGYLTSDANGVTGYLVGTGSSASSGVIEFQTDSYPPGYQFNPVIRVYGFVVDEMLDPLTTVFVGNISNDNQSKNGGLNDAYLDGSSRTSGLLPQQVFELFGMTFGADGTGTFGGNTTMVTNGHKVFYIDISPLDSHPAIVVGQQTQ